MTKAIVPGFNKPYAFDSAKRAVRTFAQTFVALISVGAVGLTDVDWGISASTAGLAALISIGQSISKIELATDAEPNPFSGVSEALDR